MIPPEESVLTRDDTTAFAPPPAFGPFRVLHQIGVGALGPVFRTYEPARDRLVAVKVFRLDITPEQAQALAGELARAAEADLFHPSVVEPIAAGVEGTVAYRAEEYVAADSLDVAMRHEAPAPLAAVLRIVAQLGEAIDIARAAGVGHGALHPRDIFVTPQDARASGFGIVDALERVGIRAPVRRPYSAPERVAGANWSTPADVFSLAAVAFELLTGRRPSGTGDQIGALDGASVTDPAAVQAVLARAMDEDPAARFATAKEFAEALAAAGGADVDMPPPSKSELRPIGIAAIPPAADFADEPDFADEGAVTPAAVPASGDPGRDEPREAAEAHDEIDESEASDIQAERDEDIAQWALTLDEAAAETDASAEPVRYSDIEDEVAADQLAFDAVDVPEPPAEARVVPIVAPGFGDRPAETAAASGGPAAMRGRPRNSPRQVIEREADSDRPDETPLDGPSNGDRGRPAMLPLAVMLIVGLLLGFGAGYFVGARNEPVQTTASASATTPPVQQPEPVGVPDTPPPANEQVAGTQTPAPAPPSASPREKEARAASPAAGRLVVRSTPAGAAVTIDGRWSGRTPFTRESLPFGEHTVRIVLPGYLVHRQQVNISAASAAPVLSVRLEREPQASPGRGASATSGRRGQDAEGNAAPAGAAAGVLEVDSRPTGARVFVDDGPVGTTPVRLPDVAPGRHIVRMEMPGHQTWTETADVTRGRTTRVAGSLEPIR